MVSLEGFNTPLRTKTLLNVASSLNSQGIKTLVIAFHRPDQILEHNPLYQEYLSKLKEFKDYLPLASSIKSRLQDPSWVDQVNGLDPRGTQLFFETLWFAYVPLLRKLKTQGFIVLNLATNLSTVGYTMITSRTHFETSSTIIDSQAQSITRCLLDDFSWEQGMGVARQVLDSARYIFMNLFQSRGIVMTKQDLQRKMYLLVKNLDK